MIETKGVYHHDVNVFAYTPTFDINSKFLFPLVKDERQLDVSKYFFWGTLR